MSHDRDRATGAATANGRDDVDAEPATPLVELLTVDDVCALLKVKPSWVYDEVERRRLPSYKLGKMLRFHPDDVANLLGSAYRPSA